ncbi:MAG: Dabb family protein [Planctomycetia bacterium]
MSGNWIKIMATAAVLAAGVGGFSATRPGSEAAAAVKAEPKLVHNVYFTTVDDSPETVAKLVDTCNKHLAGIPGIVSFSAGPRAADLKREVNDVDFNVGLHVVFENRAAHDVYQDHADHLKFIEAGKPLWKKVRVFDALVENHAAH